VAQAIYGKVKPAQAKFEQLATAIISLCGPKKVSWKSDF
jgi:hypothetical protein